MKLRMKSLILIALLLSTVVLAPRIALAQADALLQDIPINQLNQPGTFIGTLSITAIDYNPGRDVLTVAGVLTGSGSFSGVNQTFEQTATIRSPDEAGVCDILFLDIGPIFLDLLGLTVDLSPIELDVDAVPGEGRLLGNLLCALTGLLDPANDGLLEGLTGLVNSLLNSLERLINELLGA